VKEYREPEFQALPQFLARQAAVTLGDLERPPDVELTDIATAVEVRRALVALAARVLDPQRLADFEVAVGEIATNAIVHGRPPVSVRMWTISGPVTPVVVVAVHDRGTGPVDPLVGMQPPNPDQLGGFGMWIARNWSDALDVLSDDSGCTVRLAAAGRPAPRR